VEDIIDTGLTLSYLLNNLHSRNPASLRICTLLNKPENRRVEIPIDYVGFEVPNAFLVGYGLDFKQLYRNIPFVFVPKKELIENL
jgi:hypoxanthine phosphoribosyltransferase